MNKDYRINVNCPRSLFQWSAWPVAQETSSRDVVAHFSEVHYHFKLPFANNPEMEHWQRRELLKLSLQRELSDLLREVENKPLFQLERLAALLHPQLRLERS